MVIISERLDVDYDLYYTIEYKGSKGWEVIKTYDKTVGAFKVTQAFLKLLVNNDGQYRLTTPE